MHDTIGRYRVIKKLGTGGMGEVYLAEDPRLHRQVALKVIADEVAADPRRRARFEREAHAASILTHPNICSVHEIGETDAGALFIAMEYVDGTSLKHRLERGAIPLSELLEIAIEVAEALAEAQRHGVVHRDIKPHNIMLTAAGRVKVVDFGLAQLSGDIAVSDESATALRLTAPGAVIGTVHYMSPEQARGEALDARSDLFSFGSVLYEMAGGHVAFPGGSSVEILNQVIHADPAPLRAVVPELQRIIGKCLEKRPERRYQSAADLAVDLRSVRDHRATTPARPKRLLAVIAGALILAILGWTLWRTVASPTERIDSIAVLPFENNTRDSNLGYISDGLTETIINALSQIGNLRVVPRASVVHFKNATADPLKIAKDLNTAAVLTGIVSRTGEDSLAIQVELSDVKQRSQVWGKRFVTRQADVLSVQEQISTEVLERLRVRVTPAIEQQQARRSTLNREAFDLYLKGRYFANRRTPDALREAVKLLEEAVAKDPNYASAYRGLAEALDLSAEYAGVPWDDVKSRVEHSVDRALQLDPSSAEAHAYRGLLHMYDWDWDAAVAEYERANKLDPSYVLAYRYRAIVMNLQGRHADALRIFDRALQLDPLSSILHANRASTLHALGKTREAESEAARLVRIDPDFSLGHQFLGEAYAREGKQAEAIDELQKAAALSQRSPIALARLGFTYALLGQRENALEVAHELEEKHKLRRADGAFVAVVYAGLRDNDKVFEWLNKDQTHSLIVAQVVFWWEFQTVHDDPRWTTYMHKVRLR